MKRYRLGNIALLLCSMVFCYLSGCSKNDTPDPYLELSVPELVLTASDVTQSFEIKTNTDWYIIATEASAWCRISPNSGKSGTTKVEITTSPNADYIPRQTDLKITAGTLTSTFKVTQQAVLSLDPEINALIAFYNATDGPHWKNSTNWMSDKPVGEWNGIKVNAEGQIIEIYLPNNGLKGRIPNEIAQMSALKHIYLQQNNLDGEFPKDFCRLSNLEVLYLFDNQLTGQLPEDFTKLTKLRKVYMYRNLLSGPLPEKIGDLSAMETLLIQSNRFNGKIPASIGQLHYLSQLRLFGNQLTGSLPESIGELTLLKALALDGNQLSGSIPECIGNLTTLQYLTLNNNGFTGSLPSSMERLIDLQTCDLRNNFLSGNIPEALMKHQQWDNWVLIPQYGAGFANFGGDVESDDYSQDGTVITYARSSGKGVDLVFTGDGFTSQDMGKDGADGVYERRMKQAIETLFSVEPYKTYRSLFNVYIVRAVSPQNGITEIGRTRKTCFSTYFVKANDRTVDLDRNALYKYAVKAPVPADMKDVMIGVVANTQRYGGTAYWYYDGGPSYGIATLHSGFEATVRHEVGGHVIGKLADEYTERDELTEEDKTKLTAGQSRGYYQNVDRTDNLSAIRWKHFVGRPGYEAVGAYEGGFYARRGVWRSEETSCMNTNALPFNAVSREQIVQKIFEVVGKPYNFSEFLSKDVIPPKTKVDYVSQSLPPLPPPVILEGRYQPQ